MPRYGENIYKRKDGRWEGRYIKGRKENGRIQYGYVYSANYSEVRKILFDQKVKHQEQYIYRWKQSGHYTLQEWSDIWLKEQQQLVAANTFRSYQSKFNNNILPFIGYKKLSLLSEEELHQLVSTLQKEISAASIHIVFQILKTCLSAAEKQGLLNKNPAKNVVLPKQEKHKVQAFSKKEQMFIEKAVAGQKDYAILMALHTGMRISEICGLKWQDIDFDEKIISVERSVQRKRQNDSDKKTVLMDAPLKTASSRRMIPMNKRIFNMLWSLFLEEKRGEYVFSRQKASPIDPRSINYRFTKLKENAVVSDLPFHALRHTFATRCIEAGVPIPTISELLGHASIKMTLDTYTNSFLNEKRSAVERITLTEEF